ncbi:MAG: hypothetical protein ABF335_02755 [Alphaproteobacteria bacterium]
MISSQVGPFAISSDIALPLAHGSSPDDKAAVRSVSLTQGPVPDALDDPIWESGPIQVTDRRFLFRLPTGLAYLLEDGQAVTYDYQGEGELSEKDVQLFFLGPVFGALCAQHNLLPLHASSLRHKHAPEKLFGFTGHSGAGKSTMGAAFTQRGFELFSDDILVLDPTSATEQQCYRGHKGSKLWIDAVDHFALDKGERISRLSDREKYYVGQDVDGAMGRAQLDGLYFLHHESNAKVGANIMIFRRDDIHAIKLFHDGLYRPLLIEAIMGRRALYQGLAQLAETIPLYVVHRPFHKEDIDRCVDMIVEHLTAPVDVGVPDLPNM